MRQKFTDSQMVHQHSMGKSDREIAEVFGCAASTVAARRYKLNLKPNNPGPIPTDKTPKEQRRAFLERNMRTKTVWARKNRDRLNLYEREWRKKNRRRYRRYMRKYRQRYRGKINAYQREWHRRRRSK